MIPECNLFIVVLIAPFTEVVHVSNPDEKCPTRRRRSILHDICAIRVFIKDSYFKNTGFLDLLMCLSCAEFNFNSSDRIGGFGKCICCP